MKKVLVIALALTITAAGLAVAGSGEGTTKMHNSGDKVQVSVTPSQLSAKAGERISFKVNFTIEQKWHLYAHEDSMFIGIDLVPADGFPLTDVKIVYPAGHEGEFFGEMVVILEGSDVVIASGTVPEDLASGEYALDLALTVQACDDKICLAPAYLPVAVVLTVP